MIEMFARMLAEASVRSLAAAVLVGVVLLALRVRASGVRHAAWTGVLCAMLLMPALPSLVPALPLPSPVPEMAPGDMWSRLLIDRAPMDGAIAPGDAPSGPTLRQPTAAESVAVPGVVRFAARPAGPLSTLIPLLMPAALVLYGFVMSVLLVRLVRGWRAAARIARTGTVVDAKVSGSSIVVVESPAVCVPVTVGILYPSIVLPIAWRTWPESKLLAVLAHERAHVRRRDPLVQFLARLNGCVFWVHPLAWWLQRKLATTAEHAADEAAIQETGERHGYAEVLLDMAEAVRRTGGRVAWQGVGVDGSGLLGERIDRILRGRMFGAISRKRKLSVALACVTTILVVVACRPSATPAPLKPNAEVAERIEKQKAERELVRRAQRMTAAEVDAIEASLKEKPDNLDALRKLLFFYTARGAKTFGWNEMVRRRRPHVLRLIDHHPDLDDVQLISASADPGEYAEAKTHWLAQTGNPGATARTFSNAAWFFASKDPALAEKFILQARTLDPDASTVVPGFPRSRSHWSERLGMLYGDVLRGPLPKDDPPLPPPASDPFAIDVRKRLEESKDAALLRYVGWWVDRDFQRRELGLHFLERAVELDPQLTDGRRSLVWRRRGFERAKWTELLRTKQAELAGGDFPTKVRTRAKLTRDEQEKLRSFEYEAVSSLPEADRFICLEELTDHAYMWGEHLAYTMKDKVGADAAYQRSKKAAEALLALAEKHRERPDYGEAIYRANIALGLHAIREGNRERAVRYMVAAGKAPASESLATAVVIPLDSRLTDWLLKDGERESVASFFDRAAQLRPLERARLTKDAAAIRAGQMPESYQYRMTRT